jgi:hypothetical protein
MREAGDCAYGTHTRLPSAARGARLPAPQGSLVWGKPPDRADKTLTSFGATSAGVRSQGENPREARRVVSKPSAPAK